jgi:hypothetical protein
MPTTESGWPVLQSGDDLIRTINIPNGTKTPTRVPLRWGTPALQLGILAMAFDERVQAVDGPIVDDWGYALRAVRGYSVYSDHAGGIAMDINATKHPLGVGHTFSQAQVDKIHKLLKHFEGCIYWGGDYHNRVDAMHFGMAKSLKACEPVSRRLLTTARGEMLCAANPGLRAYVLS